MNGVVMYVRYDDSMDRPIEDICLIADCELSIVQPQEALQSLNSRSVSPNVIIADSLRGQASEYFVQFKLLRPQAKLIWFTNNPQSEGIQNVLRNSLGVITWDKGNIKRESMVNELKGILTNRLLNKK